MQLPLQYGPESERAGGGKVTFTTNGPRDAASAEGKDETSCWEGDPSTPLVQHEECK